MPNAFPASNSAAVRARRPRLVRWALWLGRALRAPRERKSLWLGTLLLVALVRLGLWTVSLRALQVLVARLGRGRYSEPIPAHASRDAGVSQEAPQVQVLAGTPEAAAVRDSVWAVRSSARAVPGATCLTQALALQVLLGRRGLGSRLCLGARKDAGGQFQAHAWVERGGRVVIGGEEASSWTPLTSWDFSSRGSSAR